MKYVCAYDSFKGCLTSSEAARAARVGILASDQSAEVVIVQGSDGGEGLCEAVHAAGHGEWRCTRTTDPLGRPIDARWLMDQESATAYIEMAAASGLTMLPDDQKSPMNTTTFGTGTIIRVAISSGARRICLGLGGSATNDAGLGALGAIGAKFFDESGDILPSAIRGADLLCVANIDVRNLSMQLEGVTIDLLCDVRNPFIGPDGAVAVYARQKGADADMRRTLERGMENVARRLREGGFIDVSDLPGSGAAGGMAGGFIALAGATVKSGAEEVVRLADLDRHLLGASAIFTGEGSSDTQTLCGKYPATVLRHALTAEVPCLLTSGRITDRSSLLKAGFAGAECINSSMNTGSIASAADPLDPEIAARRLAATAQRLTANLKSPSDRK